MPKVIIAWVYAEIIFNDNIAAEDVVLTAKGIYDPRVHIVENKYDGRFGYMIAGIIPGKTMVKIHKNAQSIVYEGDIPTQIIDVLMTYN